MNNSRYIFRGKCLYNANKDKWTYGCLSTTKEQRPYAIEHIGKRDEWVSEHIDPQTVGQCTGLKDKLGTLIFEGDIIKGKNIQGIVSWMPEHCAYMVKTLIDGCVTGYEYLTSGDGKTLDVFVIGNIYEKGDEK